MQVRIIMRYYFLPTRIVIVKKVNVDEDIEKLKPSCNGVQSGGPPKWEDKPHKCGLGGEV